jgi:serine/threonine protein phosphatase 1
MGRWRPSPKSCLYVIPDVHGMLQQLKVIFNRILPLRNQAGCDDRLVMLGDYIDRGQDSHFVIDLLIQIKKRYGDQVVLLMGNHEQMLLRALDNVDNSRDYIMWMKNGGEQTLAGYIKRKGESINNPYQIRNTRLRDYIPVEHAAFLHMLEPYYETDDYIFVHAGCDPLLPMERQEPELLYWSRQLFQSVLRLRDEELSWDKTIVTGHCGQSLAKPYIRQKYMMLDCSWKRQLLLLELNSMGAMMAKDGNGRLVRYDLEAS